MISVGETPAVFFLLNLSFFFSDNKNANNEIYYSVYYCYINSLLCIGVSFYVDLELRCRVCNYNN